MGARLSYPEEDQSGRVAVVTGGNTGIGYETAKGLALLGAHVVIACRNEEKATAAIERMRADVAKEHPDKSINVEFMALDLSSLQSVKKFTDDYKQKGLPLHMLINNAGILVKSADIARTGDGMESQFQVNHLSPLYLTLELLPIILTSAPNARVVYVNSEAHKLASAFDLENLQAEKSVPMSQYGNSKGFNLMAAAALMRRLAGKGVTVSAVHPGFVQTDLFRTQTGLMKHALTLSHAIGMSRDAVKGAATTLYAAVHPDLNKEEFVYYSNCSRASCSASCRNIVNQEQLWEISWNLLKDFLSPDIARDYGPSQPTNAGELQPSSEQDQQSSPEEDQQPSPEQDQQPSLEQDQQPSPEQDQQPSPEQDQQPSPEQDQQPSPEQDQQPSPELDQQPSPEQDQQPSPELDQQPSPEQDQQPSPEQDQEPSPEQDQQPSPEQNQQTSPELDQQPSSEQDQQPSPEQDQQSSADQDE